MIASGSRGHLHAYWPLTDPVSVPVVEQANRRLAAQLRGDVSAVTNAATRVTKGASSKKAALAMAYKLTDAAQQRWRPF